MIEAMDSGQPLRGFRNDDGADFNSLLNRPASKSFSVSIGRHYRPIE
jgi:hypothetical protein